MLKPRWGGWTPAAASGWGGGSGVVVFVVVGNSSCMATSLYILSQTLNNIPFITMILMISSWGTAVGHILFLPFFLYLMSSRHSGDTAPWWREGKTVKRWQDREDAGPSLLGGGGERCGHEAPPTPPTAGCWCLSLQWRSGDCRRAGRQCWSRDCCGPRTRGSEPGDERQRRDWVTCLLGKYIHFC